MDHLIRNRDIVRLIAAAIQEFHSSAFAEIDFGSLGTDLGDPLSEILYQLYPSLVIVVKDWLNYNPAYTKLSISRQDMTRDQKSPNFGGQIKGKALLIKKGERFFV